MDNTTFSMPRLGDPAPAFSASTTEGPIDFPADYNGRWVILFSHPADFTPVCTSEFMTFGSLQKDFENLGCQLVGLSVDGLSSHIAWLRRIEEKVAWKGMKGLKIRFSLIDDVSMKIANMYGMIQPGQSQTAAVRAVFFIDPQGTVRTIIYYPLSLGRNFDEIKRVLIGLQTTDNFRVSLPADWRPGDEVIGLHPRRWNKLPSATRKRESTCKTGSLPRALCRNRRWKENSTTSRKKGSFTRAFLLSLPGRRADSRWGGFLSS